MTKDRFVKGWEDTLGVSWDSASQQEVEDLISLPRGSMPLPSDAHAARATLPEDVRASIAHGSVGAMTTLRVGPVDVTVMFEPPADSESAGLWTLSGRAWLREGDHTPFLVYLVQDDHVLAQQTLRHGDRFEVQDILQGEPVLEFHLGDGTMAAVGVPLP